MTDIDISKFRRLDGNLLLVFRELLRCGNATLAAQRLSLSQSAVSHALARLRDLLGDPLFVRRPHGLEPTRRALELGPRIDALIALAAETLEGAAPFDPRLSQRRFSVAAPEFVTAIIGAPLLQRLGRAAPMVSLQVKFLPHDLALDTLRRGELDLVLGRFGQVPHDDLAVQALFEDRYCVAARARHPLLRGVITLSQYLDIGHVLATGRSEGAPEESIRGEIRTLSTVPQWLTALHLVAASDAIATCPRRLAVRHARPLRLQVLDTPFALDPFTVSAIHRRPVLDGGIAWLLQQIVRVTR